MPCYPGGDELMNDLWKLDADDLRTRCAAALARAEKAERRVAELEGEVAHYREFYRLRTALVASGNDVESKLRAAIARITELENATPTLRSDAKRTTPPTPTELVRLIALEYYRWDYVCSRSAQPGTSARDRFESNLEHALEQAGLDPRALYQEAAGNAIFNR